MATTTAKMSPERQGQQEKILRAFRTALPDSGDWTEKQVRILLNALGVELSEERLRSMLDAASNGSGKVTYEQLISWLFSCDLSRRGSPELDEKALAAAAPSLAAPPRAAPPQAAPPQAAPPQGSEAPIAGAADSRSMGLVESAIRAQLEKIVQQHPYVEVEQALSRHPATPFIENCRKCLEHGKFEQAQEELRRTRSVIETDMQQISEAFRRFDKDSSGFLEAGECRHMCAYLGWGSEGWSLFMNKDEEDGKISLQKFQAFVGKMGGIRQLFEQRRLRISTSRKDVCDYIGIAEGARVRAHYFVQGQKSHGWREAQVLKVGVHMHFGKADMGPGTFGVLLQFGFGTDSTRKWTARQVVPPAWILSGVEDASVASALRESGILDEQQAFWGLLLPETEMQAIARLESCQRKALYTVRAQATRLHDEALPKLRERFTKLGYGDEMLGTVLDWIQDLAPVVVHVHLDRVGAFMEIDEFYRNQFETKTSCGALDPENRTRQNWERELFGGAYDDAKPFDRCKYGALSVMNDYRGVVSARQYGDSYLVLKDVRLRCTFASTDSGGIQGSRLAVLDKYAHVLNEYNDGELQGVILVASHARAGTSKGTVRPELLRGSTEDPVMDWVTLGYPALAQGSGKYYFEVHLIAGAEAPQVGLLSQDFKMQPMAPSTQGVGDCENGWAVDGQGSIRWHRGEALPWSQTWPSLEGTHKLSGDVTICIAVDLDQRKMYFTTDGQWDSKWMESPTFGQDQIPAGAKLYPAMSIKGRASFDFGPYWKYKPPNRKGRPSEFDVWRHSLPGVHRVDVPHIGNSETLSIYKEVQIHGEISLKRNVQRLVAARKYRDMHKMQRSFGLRVSNASVCNGAYKRVGSHDNMPLYRSGNDSVIFFCSKASEWRMALKTPKEEDQFNSCYCAAKASSSVSEPPRTGWTLPDEERGVLPKEFFFNGLKKKGATDEVINGLWEKLAMKDPSKAEDAKTCIFRRAGGIHFDKEWASLENPPCDAAAAWKAGVLELQESLMQEYGISGSQVVESEHPYEAKGFRWTKEVTIPGAAALVVEFYNKSCTYDSSTKLTVFSGGLRRDSAGPGARVELHTCCNQRVWGTVLERTGDAWKVLLDRRNPNQPPRETTRKWPQVGDRVEAQYFGGMFYACKVAEIKEIGGVTFYVVDWDDGDVRDKEKQLEHLRPIGGGAPPAAEVVAERSVEDVDIYRKAAPEDTDVDCFAYCKEAVSRVQVRYQVQEGPKFDEQGFSSKIGDELLAFKLDRTCPLTPIAISQLSDQPGPAQAVGVQCGWYLDLPKTFSGPSREALAKVINMIGGVKLEGKDTKQILEAVMGNLEEFLEVMNNKVRNMTTVILWFVSSSSATQPVLLPEARVTYPGDLKPSSELSVLGRDGKQDVVLKSVCGSGPAEAAGVRPGWAVDWPATLALNPKVKLPCKQDFFENPSAILETPGISLAFRNLHPVKSRQRQSFGATSRSCWKSLEISGDYCEFEFQSDGDGAGYPEQRWGFWALVSAKPIKDETQEEYMLLEVEKKEGQLLGISTTDVEGLCVITEIIDGPVKAWNDAHPDKALKIHDCITEVNGVKDCYESILNELRKFQMHKIVAKKSKLPLCSQGHVLKPDPRVFNSCDICGVHGTEWRCPSGCDFDMCLTCYRDVTGGEVPSVIQDVDAFAQKRVQVVSRGEGNQSDPQVERDSWDEQRLRALCARHGWDFEWMTEDGERRRRADERLTEWKLEESMAAFLKEDAEEPDQQSMKTVEEQPEPPKLLRIAT